MNMLNSLFWVFQIQIQDNMIFRHFAVNDVHTVKNEFSFYFSGEPEIKVSFFSDSETKSSGVRARAQKQKSNSKASSRTFTFVFFILI